MKAKFEVECRYKGTAIFASLLLMILTSLLLMRWLM